MENYIIVTLTTGAAIIYKTNDYSREEAIKKIFKELSVSQISVIDNIKFVRGFYNGF